MKYLSVNLLIISLFLLVFNSVQAKITLPSVFTDNMVLQQKTEAAVWGHADPGKTVNITNTWSKKKYSTQADKEGNWKIKVSTPVYGGPYTMTISDGEPTVLKNILIGDVWVCSGQSNMEMPLAGWGKINNYQKELEQAKYPNIRLLQAVHVTSDLPLENAQVSNGGWQPCTPEFVGEFSATAYFFAREVYTKTGIPIGLIHSSWGGTVAEAWTSKNTLVNLPDFAEAASKIGSNGMNQEQQLNVWKKAIQQGDAGYKEGKPIWLAKSLDVSTWKTISLPAFVEQSVLPDFDGVVYFRKKITIPESWSGKAVKVSLGTIDDNDITYFDGEKIGETEGYNIARNYMIAPEKMSAGEHELAIRVFDGGGGGGIYGEKNILALTSSNNERISLDGDWNYNVGLDIKQVGPAPLSSQSPNRPSVLFNAMINPFIQFNIRGVIWYQGESNSSRANQYRELFPSLIKDWRQHWKLGDFPFYFVQLANYARGEGDALSWPELRNAQLSTLSLPNTAMAVSIDIGNPEDVHPKNKQEVGRRLALIALAKTYRQKIPYSGPLLESHVVKGSEIILSFKFADGGLKIKEGNELIGFTIAGQDQVFHPAKASIKGTQIIISSPDVPVPIAVRYGWSNNPGCNLYNGAGLPASPFRTDKWQDSTYGKK
ncbi:MAG: 9-O-acetylesterase [Daejeonella sp.]|nr:9-O-acetylesterase [Daejeonella sp.]